MSIFQLTEQGKCDVVITLFTKENSIFLQRSRTYDIKPTLKELKEEFKVFKQEGANSMRITSTPSCQVREFKL